MSSPVGPTSRVTRQAREVDNSNSRVKNQAPAIIAHAEPTGPPEIQGTSSSRSNLPRSIKGSAIAFTGAPMPRLQERTVSAWILCSRGLYAHPARSHCKR
jgi:hypothetical protein